jgi:Uncharacterized conserved protein (DUF2190)
MAGAPNYERVRSISRIAGADFSGTQGEYRFCKINPNPATVNGTSIDPGAVILAGNGDRAVGVLIGKQVPGHAIEVGVGGRLLVVAGAAIAYGAAVQSDANGAAITQASTGCVEGIAYESASQAGDIISIEFAPQGAP